MASANKERPINKVVEITPLLLAMYKATNIVKTCKTLIVITILHNLSLLCSRVSFSLLEKFSKV